MDHILNASVFSTSALNKAASGASSASGVVTAASSHALAAGNSLKPGSAITLHAKQLSVLRISHGRVWVTLTDVGPYSRVAGGDHFLSRGDSLTLLPGQQLVMESFGIGHAAPAQFRWEDACAAPLATPVAAAQSGDVAQSLRDLRYALGLVAAASGRLVSGLALGFATPIAMVFVAARTGNTGARGTFNTLKPCAATPLADYRLR